MVITGSQPGNGSRGFLLVKSQAREGMKDKKNTISGSSQAGLVPGVNISTNRAIGKAGEIAREKSRTAMESAWQKVEDHILKDSVAQQVVADTGLYQPFPARNGSGSDSDDESSSGSRSGSDSDNESASGSRSGSDSDDDSASGSRSGSGSHHESASGSRSGRGSDITTDGSSSSSSRSSSNTVSKEEEEIDI